MLFAAVTATTMLGSTIGIQGAFALMGARTTNPGNLFSTASLVAPASLTVSAFGSDVILDWPEAPRGTHYGVSIAPVAADGTCNGVSWATVATPEASMFDDLGRGSPAGVTYCYRVQTRAGSAWTSVENNPIRTIKVGNVVEEMMWTRNTCIGDGDDDDVHGGPDERVQCGDTLRVVFTRPIDPTSVPHHSTVCDSGENPIRLSFGSSRSGACQPSLEDPWLGVLQGTTPGKNRRWDVTFDLTGDGTVLLVRFGVRTYGGNGDGEVGPWTLYPSNHPRTATGAAPLCEGHGPTTCTASTSTNP